MKYTEFDFAIPWVSIYLSVIKVTLTAGMIKEKSFKFHRTKSHVSN